LNFAHGEESYAEKLAGANAAESRSRALAPNCFRKPRSPKEFARLRGSSKHARTPVAASRRSGARRRSCRQPARRAKTRSGKFSRELGDARERVSKLQAERETAVDAVVRGHEAVSDTEAELTRVRDEYSRASHRLESLKELDQRRAYYSPAVQLIFSPGRNAARFSFHRHAR
jgi:septal ring factor EnvC (AmiA/AmiB activator)